MNARLLVAASLLPLAAVLLVSTAIAGDDKRSDKRADMRANIAALRGVNFVSRCGFSHRAADDPIVFLDSPARRTTIRSTATEGRPRPRRSRPCSPAPRRAAGRATRPPTGWRPSS